MIGYELLNQMNIATWMQMCTVVTAGTLVTGLTLSDNTNNINTIRRRNMFVRRYREEGGRLKALYTEIEVPVQYGYGGWQQPDKGLTPPGTEYIYLDDKRVWGYSEKKPAPKVFTFGSPDMMKEVNKTSEDG